MRPIPKRIAHKNRINPDIKKKRYKSATNPFVIFRLDLIAAKGPIFSLSIQYGTIDSLNDQRIPGIINKRSHKLINKKLIILAITK